MGKNINGKHQFSVQLGKLGHHAVLDIARVIFEESTLANFSPSSDMVCAALNAVRADIIAEVMTETAAFLLIFISNPVFISGAVEVMEDTQSFHCVKRHALGAEVCKVRVRSAPTLAKYARCFLNVLLGYGDSHILFLRNAVKHLWLLSRSISLYSIRYPSNPSCFSGMRMESSKSALFSL